MTIAMQRHAQTPQTKVPCNPREQYRQRQHHILHTREHQVKLWTSILQHDHKEHLAYDALRWTLLLQF